MSVVDSTSSVFQLNKDGIVLRGVRKPSFPSSGENWNHLFMKASLVPYTSMARKDHSFFMLLLPVDLWHTNWSLFSFCLQCYCVLVADQGCPREKLDSRCSAVCFVVVFDTVVLVVVWQCDCFDPAVAVSGLSCHWCEPGRDVVKTRQLTVSKWLQNSGMLKFGNQWQAFRKVLLVGSQCLSCSVQIWKFLRSNGQKHDVQHEESTSLQVRCSQTPQNDAVQPGLSPSAQDWLMCWWRLKPHMGL